MRKALLLALAGLLLSFSPPSQAGFRIIVHPDNPAATLSSNDVSSYLLKKKSRWQDWDERVDPIDLEAGSSTREAFSRAVHGRSVSSIKNYWQRQIFSGRNVPPPEVDSDTAVVSFVSSRRGAIGYVSPRASLDGVKEITIAN